MDSQVMNKMFKISRQRVMCARRIQRIVSQLGVPADEVLKLETILDIPSNLLEKVLMHLMTSECTRLLLFEEDMSVLMTPALKLYLADGPKVVDLTAYMSFCPVELKYETFKSAVIKTSQTAARHSVEELLLLTKGSRESKNRFPDDAVDPELLEALGKLTKLKVLRLEEVCYFDGFDDMCSLCEKLPNLQFLSINFPEGVDIRIDFDEHRVAEKLMSCISHLEVFIFNSAFMFFDFRRSFLDRLPNLQVIENFGNESFSNYDWETTTSTPDLVCPTISKLRHLFINFSLQDEEYEVTSENMHLKFPFVTNLSMFWYEEDGPIIKYQWQRLLHFPLIESLELVNEVPLEIVCTASWTRTGKNCSHSASMTINEVKDLT